MAETKTALPERKSMQEALAYFDRYLAFRQRFDRVPGVQAAAFAYGEVMLSCAHGLADVGNGVELLTSHLFRIASHSKTFTATAIMQLSESGRLRLDDTAADSVDFLVGTAIGRVTVRQLLSHSAGLFRDSTNGDFWQLYGPFPDREGLRQILLDPAATVLGTNERFKYSNIGYALLGLVIEAVTGVRYGQWVQRSILDPLALRDTGPELDPARSADYAVGYSSLDYADRRVPIEHVDTAAMAAATGFWATASDLVRYFAAHFEGDDSLLGAAAKREMQHPWWDVGAGRRYGLGLAMDDVGERRLVGHGGGYPGHITSSVVDARGGLAVSVLTNAIDGPAEALTHACVKLIDLSGGTRPVDDRSGAAAGPGAGIDPARFAGRFANLWGVTDVAVLGGRLYRLHPSDADPVAAAAELEIVDQTALRVVGGSGYGSYGELYRYEFGVDGTVSSIRADSSTTLVPLDRFRLPDAVRVGPVNRTQPSGAAAARPTTNSARVPTATDGGAPSATASPTR